MPCSASGWTWSRRGGRGPPTSPRKNRLRAADLSNAGAASTLVREVAPTHVLHAAWETRQPTYWQDPVKPRLGRCDSDHGQDLRRGDCRRFVQVGSCAEYDWSHGRCIEDVTPDRPATRYGKAKLAAYHAIGAAGHDRFASVDARIFFVYGPREDLARLIPYICRSLLAGDMPALPSGYSAEASSLSNNRKRSGKPRNRPPSRTVKKLNTGGMFIKVFSFVLCQIT